MAEAVAGFLPVAREGDTIIWDINGDKKALVKVDGKG